MKKLTKLTALLLALLMMLSCAALADETAPAPETEAPAAEDAAVEEVPAEDPVLFSFNGEDVFKSEMDEYLQNLYSNGYVSSADDYATGIEYLVQDKVIVWKLENGGWLTSFTDEEKEAFMTEAQEEYDSYLDDYVTYFLSEDTEEARAQLRLDAADYYAQYGLNVDVLYDNILHNEAWNALMDDVCADLDYAPTEEEMIAAYKDNIDYYRTMYSMNYGMDDVSLYESFGIPYRPAGYRSVLHILLDTDADLLAAYNDAVALYEESMSHEETDEAAEAAEGEAAAASEPVTAEDVEAARAALLAKHQDTIDDVYARLAAGESFESVIELYNTDPGMMDDATRAKGYEVHKDTAIYVPEFTAGAFSEKMQQPGDVSDPIISSYGIHIMYYLADLEEGYVFELTEEDKASLSEYLVEGKENELLSAAYETWLTECDIVYNEEAIAALSAD